MGLRRLTLTLVALGLAGSPVAALYCGGDDPAAMACCRQQANECNQPGKADDCCRTVPSDGRDGALAVGVKAELAAKLQALMCPAFTLAVAPIPAARGPLALAVWLDTLPHDLPPPPLSVLRV